MSVQVCNALRDIIQRVRLSLEDKALLVAVLAEAEAQDAELKLVHDVMVQAIQRASR